jgi:hypothetical protein
VYSPSFGTSETSDLGTVGELLRSLRLFKIGLSAGFVLLFVGIMAAHHSPTPGHENSIYAATPTLFWVGVGLSLFASVLTAVYAYRTRLGSFALLLGGTSILAVVALPLIRGYHYYGLADSLTHLGWARWMLGGQMLPEQLVYPGAHLVAGGIAATTDLQISRAMMLAVVLYFLVFVLFIPLCVRVLVRDRRATFIAAFSGLLFLPITNVSTHRMFHSFTLATLFVPIAFFVLFKHLFREPTHETLAEFTSPTGITLASISVVLVILHPQVALNVLILYTTFAGVQWMFRRRRPSHPIARFGGLYGQVVFLGLVLFAWNLNHGAMFNMAESVTTALENTLFENTGQAGEVVASRGESAQQIQVSLVDLFLRLFLIPALYTLAAFILSAEVIYTRLKDSRPASDNEGIIMYFVFGGIVLTPYFLAHFVGDVSSFFFRHVGFAMVIVTILATLALHRWGHLVPLSGETVRPIAVVGAVVVLVLSVLVIFPSPYIYKMNHQVTDQQMEGYETFYEQKSEVEWTNEGAVWIGGVRRSDYRFRDALVHDSPLRYLVYSGPIPESAMFSGLPTHYRQFPEPIVRKDHYVPVTEAMYTREVTVAKGLQYSAESFAALESQYGVHKVQSNGDFTNYYVDVEFGTPPVNATDGETAANTG